MKAMKALDGMEVLLTVETLEWTAQHLEWSGSFGGKNPTLAIGDFFQLSIFWEKNLNFKSQKIKAKKTKPKK